jgi:hypothetical protein
MDDHEASKERPGPAERPSESGAAAPGRGGRMSRQGKTAAVLPLLRGRIWRRFPAHSASPRQR